LQIKHREEVAKLAQRLLILRSLGRDQIVEIEATLQVFDEPFYLAALDRNRRNRCRPALGGIVLFGAVVEILLEIGSSPGFRAKPDEVRLVEGKNGTASPLLECAVEANLRREDGGERDDQDSGDECHAALPPHP